MSSTITVEQKLHAIIQSAQTILSQQTFIKSARTIFDYCRRVTGAISGYVALLNDTGEENEVLFLEAGGMPCTVDPELPMPIRGLRALAYKTHKSVYENDFMNSPWTEFIPKGHVVLNNVMFAPLNIENKTVGIIGLANKPEDFTDDDAEIASAFGDLAAIALLNSRYLDNLNEKNITLEQALAKIRTMNGILPICSHCKKIREDTGFWTQLEKFLTEHTQAQLSHGLCPDCLKELYPDYYDKIINVR